MVSGMGWLRRSLPRRLAKTARICSKRRATSRPRFEPASVMTMKCAEWNSIHGDCSAAGANGQSESAHSAIRTRIEMDRARDILLQTSAAGEEGATGKCYHGWLRELASRTSLEVWVYSFAWRSPIQSSLSLSGL